jgi:putative ABC transport system substrate-binding protein
MKRRQFVAGLTYFIGSLGIPRQSYAQAPAFLRIGSASPTPRGDPASFLIPFEQRMAELGYIEGKNFALEFITVSQPTRYDQAMQELLARNVSVIFAYGPEAPLKSVLALSRTIPIVMVAIDYDPLALGYVASLANPGGNVTGLYLEQIELAAKRIDLLKDAFPATRAITVFWDALSADQWKATRDSAAKFGIQTVGVELKTYPYDYERALAEASVSHRDFLLVMTSPYFARDRARLAQFTLSQNIGSMFVFREYVELGGLMSYGPKRTALSRRAADYVNRIARGAKPSDLPVERPTIFETVINLKTAKMLGLEFSQAMLLRADEVIE